MVERVLFIDFDGVLHPFGCGTDALFSRLHLIHRVLEQNASLRLVVHSSWREIYSADELKDMLFHERSDLADRYLGVTEPEIPRWESIEAWVELNQPAHSVCILDDEPRMFPSHITKNQDPRFRFVQCPANQGLREHSDSWDKLRGWIYSRLERSNAMTTDT